MDRGTVFRVWLPLLLALYCLYFVFVHGPGARDLTRWTGLTISLLGLAGITVARYTLGRSFSITAKATELITEGIYSRIRNPIYVSGEIFLVGVIVMVRRPAFWLILVVVILLPIQIIRARSEARVLEAKFGDEYRQYRDRTWF